MQQTTDTQPFWLATDWAVENLALPSAVIHMESVALILKRESAFGEEGLPEMLRDPMLHFLAGDRDQRLVDRFRSQLPDESTEGGK